MSYLIKKIEKEIVSFYIKATRRFLFPTSDFENYEVEKGKVILHFTFWYGEVGIEGSVGLVTPPAEVDIEAWDLSRKAGEWDCYKLWAFNIRPKMNLDDGLKLIFFNPHNTFFDGLPLLILHEFHIDNYKNLNKSVLLSDYMDWDIDEKELFHFSLIEFLKILKIEFEAELIDKPIDHV